VYLLQGGSTFLLLNTLLLCNLLIIVLILISLLLHMCLLRGRSSLGHLTHANKHESCQTHEDVWDMWHTRVRTSHVTHEWAMSHIWVRHATHWNEICGVTRHMICVTHKWQRSHVCHASHEPLACVTVGGKWNYQQEFSSKFEFVPSPFGFV